MDSDEHSSGDDEDVRKVYALVRAAENGDTAAVTRLLADEDIDPALDDDEALCKAAENGHHAVVQLLVKDRRVDAHARENHPLYIAVEKGHLGVVQVLLRDGGVEVHECEKCVFDAAEGGHIRILQEFLRLDIMHGEWEAEQMLQVAIEKGIPAVAELTLQYAHVIDNETDLFLSAVKANQLDIAAMLLSDRRVLECYGRSFRSFQALDWAAAEGRKDVLNLLLRAPYVNSEPYRAHAAVAAAAAGRMDIVTFLLDTCALSTKERDQVLALTAEGGHADALSWLLAHVHFSKKAYSKALVAVASCKGASAIVAQLLASKHTDPAYNENAAITQAAVCGDEATMALLLKDPRVDPTGGDGPLERAAERGFTGVVTQLLAVKAVRDAGCDEAFQLAARYDFPAVVKLLLALEGSAAVDPCGGHNIASYCAASCGDLELLKQLLNHPKADAAAAGYVALCAAVHDGQTDALDFLLADPRVSPAFRPNDAARKASSWFPHVLKDHPLGLAVEASDLKMLDRLLADPRVDPSARDNEALVLAIQVKSPAAAAMLERLLADPRVDPSAAGSRALAAAAGTGFIAKVERLLADPRVDPSAGLVPAARGRHAGIVKCLLLAPEPRDRVPAADAREAATAALREAAQLDEYDGAVLRLLLADPRADPLARDAAGKTVFESLPVYQEHARDLLRLQPAVMRQWLVARDAEIKATAAAEAARAKAKAKAKAAAGGRHLYDDFDPEHGSMMPMPGMRRSYGPPPRLVEVHEVAKLAWQRRRAAVLAWCDARSK